MIEGIFFNDNYSHYVNQSTFVGMIKPGIYSKEDLISYYWEEFKCPHGSYSWDSLDEILSDMTWINADRVLIVHEDIPELSDSDLRTYLEILSDNSFFDPDMDLSVVSEKLGHSAKSGIIVIFPKKYKEQIENILNANLA